MNYKYPKSLRESIRYSPSREKLNKIAIIDGNLEIDNLANSDIYWDEISHIDKLIGNLKFMICRFHHLIILLSMI